MPAATFAHFVQAANLCYSVYRRSGYCDEQASALRLSLYDFLPSATAFVIMQGREVIGTFTALLDSPRGVPSDRIFAEEVQRLRGRGRLVAEGTKFASRESAVHGQFVPRELCRCFFRWGLLNHVDDLLIVVNPKHLSHWTTVFGFEPLGSSKPCGHVKGHPGVLLRFDVSRLTRGSSDLPRGLRRIVFGTPFDEAIFGRCYRPQQSALRLLLFQEPELARDAAAAGLPCSKLDGLRESADPLGSLSAYLDALALLFKFRAEQRQVPFEMRVSVGGCMPPPQELDTLGFGLTQTARWLVEAVQGSPLLLKVRIGADRVAAYFEATRPEAAFGMELMVPGRGGRLPGRAAATGAAANG